MWVGGVVWRVYEGFGCWVGNVFLGLYVRFVVYFDFA